MTYSDDVTLLFFSFEGLIHSILTHEHKHKFRFKNKDKILTLLL